MKFWMFFVTGLSLALVATGAVAERPIVSVVIESHRFQPIEVRIPAATKVLLLIENRGSTPEEFESTDFNREKIVMPKSTSASRSAESYLLRSLPPDRCRCPTYRHPHSK